MTNCQCGDYCEWCRPELCEDYGKCHVCGGYLVYLGVLGRLVWVRCVGCGLEVSKGRVKA